MLMPMPEPMPEDNGGDFFAYAIAVHEAGHALGLSKFDYSNFVTTLGNPSYDVAHSTIPDSVLNYDKYVHDYFPEVSDIFTEPDCSPHPFDLLAIYALYQNVPLRSFP